MSALENGHGDAAACPGLHKPCWTRLSNVSATNTKGETTMSESGKRDKGNKEQKKKPKLNPKQKRKLKKEKKQKGSFIPV
jgi:hypothetical protein